MTNLGITPVWVRDNQALAQAADCWLETGAIGFDSEFVRTDTFYQVPALYQIATHDRCWLIDPLTIEDYGPLAEAFENPRLLKLVHACSEDAELLASHLGVVPVNMIDTQLLLAFCGGRWECGFAEAVREELGVELDKGATRSDWLQRPLTDVQLRYAVADAVYLLPLYERLAERLHPERRNWVIEESRARIAAGPPAQPDQYFADIKGAWKLDVDGLGRLQRLAAWRERTARELNRPRSRVVKDSALREIAQRSAQTPQDFAKVLSAGAVRRFAEPMLAALSQPSHDDTPQSRLPGPLDARASERVAELRTRLCTLAGELGIAEELLGRRKLVESLFRQLQAGKLPEAFRGWRAQLLASVDITIEG